MLLSEQRKTIINQWLPIALCLVCFLAIVIVTLVCAPSWGLMDDFGLLKMAQEFWGPPINLHAVTQNFITSGMLRPFYFSWAAVFYEFFRNWPAGFYVFIALCNGLAMVFWGVVFYKIFNVRREDRYWTIFFYPLTFFLFVPFWNIFNYLSLQEKFVVFFAPLTIYFFYKVYEQGFNRWYCMAMFFCMLCGLMSKATFIYVLFVLFLYPLLDVIVFRAKPKISWPFLWINGVIFFGYVIFTVLFQIQGRYTAKYKSGLDSVSFLERIIHLPFVMKVLMATGIIGFVWVIAYAYLRKETRCSMAVVIYAGLIAYITLLIPWGFQSYLISAIGPLALGAFFPIYAWLNKKGEIAKIVLNNFVVILLIIVFVGNIVPNIQRMADIRKTITFIKENNGSSDDVYFMPSGYSESAYAIGQFTQKKVHYCSEGEIHEGLLNPLKSNYVVFSDLFPSIKLSQVKAGDLVYANNTWKIFKLDRGSENQGQLMKVDFKKSLVHQFKALIREL